MAKWTITKLVGGMLNLVATAAGYALDISEVTNVGHDWWLLITLIIGIGLVGWVVGDLYGQNRKLLDIRPTISVEPVKDNNGYYLKIRNSGAEAVFKAQISLTAEEDPSVGGLSRYDGYWQKANRNEARIFSNQDDYIKIAERIAPPSDLNSVWLNIFYFNPKLIEVLNNTGGEAHVKTSTHYVGSYIKHEDGSKTLLEKKEYRLDVSISSSPSLRDGIYKGSFKLDIDNLVIS